MLALVIVIILLSMTFVRVDRRERTESIECSDNSECSDISDWWLSSVCHNNFKDIFLYKLRVTVLTVMTLSKFVTVKTVVSVGVFHQIRDIQILI